MRWIYVALAAILVVALIVPSQTAIVVKAEGLSVTPASTPVPFWLRLFWPAETSAPVQPEATAVPFWLRLLPIVRPTVTAVPTRPAAIVTRPVVTVTRPVVTATRPVVTVIRPVVTVTRPMVTAVPSRPAVTAVPTRSGRSGAVPPRPAMTPVPTRLAPTNAPRSLPSLRPTRAPRSNQDQRVICPDGGCPPKPVYPPAADK